MFSVTAKYQLQYFSKTLYSFQPLLQGQADFHTFRHEDLAVRGHFHPANYQVPISTKFFYKNKINLK